MDVVGAQTFNGGDENASRSRSEISFEGGPSCGWCSEETGPGRPAAPRVVMKSNTLSRDKDAKSNADIWGGSGLTPKMGKRVPKKRSDNREGRFEKGVKNLDGYIRFGTAPPRRVPDRSEPGGDPFRKPVRPHTQPYARYRSGHSSEKHPQRKTKGEKKSGLPCTDSSAFRTAV